MLARVLHVLVVKHLSGRCSVGATQVLLIRVAQRFYLIQWHYSSPSPAHAEEASI